MRASAPCWRRSPVPCAPTFSTAPGRRRSATAPAATARVLRRALGLFTDAGYELRGTELVERKSGRPLTFEIMVTARSDAMDEERMALLFAGQLKRAGINARIRPVDAVQFEGRRIAFDFDMIPNRWDQSLSPGNEQAFYWSSAAADANGSRNYMGVKSPAIDAMIDTLLKAQDRAEVVAAVRALDRVLISGFYTVPLFHLPDQWIARWTTIERPDVTSRSGYRFPKPGGTSHNEECIVILGDPQWQTGQRWHRRARDARRSVSPRRCRGVRMPSR